MRIQSPLICRLSRQTAFRRFALPMMAVAFLGLAAQSAFAHWPAVTTAKAVCNNGQIFINYTVTSWDPGSVFGSQVPPIDNALGPGDGNNPTVDVLFNGVIQTTGTGAFSAGTTPPDQFMGSLAAPLGVTSVHVSALAAGTWGDGFGGGQNSDFFGLSADVDLTTVQNCGPPPVNVRFTGGGKVVVNDATVPADGSVTVTKGFEVECDRDPTHENLELNWKDAAGAHQFHMDQITSAACTLVLPQPNPPTAPGNVINATGTGSFDGTEGYTVVFTLEDHGEPSTFDKAGFVVCQTDPANPNHCDTSPNVVLSVPDQYVSTGNIQAHVDTGH